MSDIFREVDEEIRHDRALEFWRKYQLLFLIIAVFIVIGAGAWRFSETRRINAAEAAGARFQEATHLSADGKANEAQAAFAAIGKENIKGYSQLATMRAAAERANYDKPGAVADFDAIAQNTAFDGLFQEDARLRAAMLRADNADRQEMEQRLKPLAASGAAFRSSARELLALVALRDDDLEAAGRWLDQIVVDAEAPQALKQRAQAMLGLVRSGRKP